MFIGDHKSNLHCALRLVIALRHYGICEYTPPALSQLIAKLAPRVAAGPNVPEPVRYLAKMRRPTLRRVRAALASLEPEAPL